MSTHNICFGWEIRRINVNYALLSRDLYMWYCSNNINLHPPHNTRQVTNLSNWKKSQYLPNFCTKIFVVIHIRCVSRNHSNEYPQHMFSLRKKKVRIRDNPTYLGLYSSVKRSFLQLSHIGKVKLTCLTKWTSISYQRGHYFTLVPLTISICRTQREGQPLKNHKKDRFSL